MKNVITILIFLSSFNIVVSQTKIDYDVYQSKKTHQLFQIGKSAGNTHWHIIVTKASKDSAFVSYGKLKIDDPQKFYDSLSSLGFKKDSKSYLFKSKINSVTITNYNFVGIDTTKDSNDSIFKVDLCIVFHLKNSNKNHTIYATNTYTKLNKDTLAKSIISCKTKTFYYKRSGLFYTYIDTEGALGTNFYFRSKVFKNGIYKYH